MAQTTWTTGAMRLVAAAAGGAVVGAGVLYGALVAGAPLPALPTLAAAAPVRYERTSVSVLEWNNKELKRLLEAGYEVEDSHPNGTGVLVYILRKPVA